MIVATPADSDDDGAHLTRDDGVDDGPAVADHENKLGIGKQLLQVNSGSQREWIFVAESFGRLSVLGDDFQYECRDGRVQDFGSDARLFQPPGLERRSHPLLPESQHAGHDPRLLPAPDVRVRVQQDSQQRCPAARHSSDKYYRCAAIIREPDVFAVLVRDDVTLRCRRQMTRKVLQFAGSTYLRTDVFCDARLCEQARRTVILIKEAHQGEGDDCQ